MTTDSEMETTQPDSSGSAASAGASLAVMLQNASDVTFVEGRVPYIRANMKVSPVDVPPATREDIENFVRATAPQDAIEKLDAISQKSREDYTQNIIGDTINFSIPGKEFSYRGCYRMSRNGASLDIRRIPKHTPLHVSPSNQLGAESPTNQLTEP